MKNFNQLKKDGRIVVWAIDGLDGAGKGTVASQIIKMLGDQENIMQVSLPFYESKWGKILKYLLYVDDMNLTQEERMAAYALNRIEIVDFIKKAAVKSLKNNENSRIIILFDRFPFSSFITSSYYLFKNKYKDFSNEELIQLIKNKNIDLDVKERIDFIMDLENYFFDTFGRDVKIYIPAIDPKVSIERLLNDSERKGADKYEDLKVQLIGSYIYEESQKYYKSLKLFPQNHRTPEVIAREALGFFEYNPSEDNVKLEKIESVKKINEQKPSKETMSEMHKLFKKYPALKKLEELDL